MSTLSAPQSAETSQDVERVASFLHDIFGHGREYILSHPDVVRPRGIRYIEQAARVVSAHVIEGMQLAVGSGHVAAARIELVGTAQEHRLQGLCRLLIQDTLHMLRAQGTAIAIIFGYPLFRTFGFEHCIPTYEQTIPDYSPPGSAIIHTAALRNCRSQGLVREPRDADIPVLTSLYAAGNPSGNLGRKRSHRYWEHLVRTYGLHTYRVIEAEGEVRGYVRTQGSDGTLCVREAVGTDQGTCQTILHETFLRANAANAAYVVFHCPHASAFGDYIRGLGAAEYSPYAFRETNLQMRLLDPVACLRLQAIHMSDALQKSELANDATALGVTTAEHSFALTIRNGRVSVSDAGDGDKLCLPLRAMSRLVAGFPGVQVADALDITPEQKRLLQVLFPGREPYWYIDDL